MSWPGFGTYGTQVGIIGASAIGRRVIELLAPFDLTVALSDPTVGVDEAASLGVTLMSLDDLMRTSRVVSLHAPLLDSTVGMIGAAELAALPDGATFINTARGALVDESALVRELRSGRIDAVLDVTWPEPPVADSPLWTLPNVVLTPHVAGSAGSELVRMASSAVREVAEGPAGRAAPPPGRRRGLRAPGLRGPRLRPCQLVNVLLPIGSWTRSRGSPTRSTRPAPPAGGRTGSSGGPGRGL